ncbi:Oidioi.mRNA.OKI2018_I69.XSR.g16210.t1.cds [Oikopleura dioica]|uniref:Oidioi.mRNA.OKI2018_I69.XSR.g16210.t1.cds n=1 Tax=Oikopleura dioica TaxID=34765 RepID=A0ABN7SMQ7_OIKDI|nr:Oidioi.mRNA.OKI2018_I69.XSR.g16210.t1.cds [Oikopleura dioica]
MAESSLEWLEREIDTLRKLRDGIAELARDLNSRTTSSQQDEQVTNERPDPLQQERSKADPEVIIISDSEDSSDVIEVPLRKLELQTMVDEGDDTDLVVTGVKEGEIFSHHRQNCPTHAFKEIYGNLSHGSNNIACDKCFCHVCDVKWSNCLYWTNSNAPHCNAWRQSYHWKAYKTKWKSRKSLLSPKSLEKISL